MFPIPLHEFIMSSPLSRVRNALLAFVFSLISLCFGAPALADAGAFLNSASYADLEAAIASTKDSTRLAELQEIEAAIAESDDRAQLSNSSSHNIGVFARYKKDPAETPASFYVLGPNHQTDDDYELVALLVPPQVSLSWGDGGKVAADQKPRLARILEGEQLELSDPAESQDDAQTAYALNLPAFTVTNTLAGVAELPALSQAELDLAPETAPLD